MTVKSSLYFGILLCLISLSLNAQTTLMPDSRQLLIGHWVFVKTLDANNDNVEYIKQEHRGSDGGDSYLVAKGPDITYNADHTCVEKFNEVNSDKGIWQLLTNSIVKFEMIIEKDSRQGNLVKQTQELMGVKWRTDSIGNYLTGSYDTIVLLTEKEMKVQYYKKYVLFYKKR